MEVVRTINIEDFNIHELSNELQELGKVVGIKRIEHKRFEDIIDPETDEVIGQNELPGLITLEVDNTWVAADDNILDNAITAHDPATDSGFAIHDLVPKAAQVEPVGIINYKTGLTQRLYPVREFDNGLVTKVTWYKDCDGTTHTNAILQVDVNYTLLDDSIHNSTKRVKERETTRKWFKKNGQLDEKQKKVTKKYYPHIIEANKEGKRRRQNIFDMLTYDVVVLLMFTQTAGDQQAAEDLGLDFVDGHEGRINNFIQASAAQILISDISADVSRPWLDNNVPTNPAVQASVPKAVVGETIRQYINRSFSGAL